MRGVTVDFDLLDIKNQMANQPKTTEVKAREDFIEQRLNRRAARRAARMAEMANQEKTSTVEVDAPSQEEPKEEAKPVHRERKIQVPPKDPTTHAKEVARKTVQDLPADTKFHEGEVTDSEPPKPRTRRIKKKSTEEDE